VFALFFLLARSYSVSTLSGGPPPLAFFQQCRNFGRWQRVRPFLPVEPRPPRLWVLSMSPSRFDPGPDQKHLGGGSGTYGGHPSHRLPARLPLLFVAVSLISSTGTICKVRARLAARLRTGRPLLLVRRPPSTPFGLSTTWPLFFFLLTTLEVSLPVDAAGFVPLEPEIAVLVSAPSLSSRRPRNLDVVPSRDVGN